MINLRRVPEALAEGWYVFRATLSRAPRHKTTMYYQTKRPPLPIFGDVWVVYPGTTTYYWTGYRWKEIEYNKRFG